MQAQIDEIVTIMRDNVEKVLELDKKLKEFDKRSGAIVVLIGFRRYSESKCLGQ